MTRAPTTSRPPPRRWLVTMAIWFAAALLACAPARAQEVPALTAMVADVIRIDGENKLTATGNVELHAGGRLLRAQMLSFDRSTNTLLIGGPIFLQDGPDVVLLADSAEMDPELRTGLIRGARLILQQQLQVAGAEMERTDARFSEFRQVVASSCEVCAKGDAPLWEIHARRVIHDEETRELFFYNAQFRIAGVPVFYLPTLRLPDGTRDRVRGFLTPSVRTTSELGPGLKLPYFFPIGDHADLTLTPYVATNYTYTLEGRYRQAFENGDIEFSGALSRDSIRPGETRGFLFGDGRFDIPRDYELRFDIETTTDDPYLRDYDYSDKDRLDSGLGIYRTQRNERIEAETVYYQSLRSDEENDTVPTLVGDARWDRRRALLGGTGGWFDLDLIAHGHMRPSQEDFVGRDMARLRATLAWTKAWTGPSGLRFGGNAVLNGDVVRIYEDSEYPSDQSALTPTAAVEASWPLARTDASGARHLVEPVAQLVWTKPDTLDTPNDDSTLVAFDSGNLLSLNRFPGLDRYEEGWRANLALRWSRLDPDGWSFGLTGGRVLRDRDQNQFSPGSGLTGTESNWLGQIDFEYGGNLLLRNLILLDSGFEPTLNETRFTWISDTLDLSSGYIWQRADTDVNLMEDLSEFSLDADYNITDRWAAELDLRHDLTEQQTNRARLGLSWRNECVRVDLSVLRRFRATEEQEPTTSYGLSVSLAGFGEDKTRPALRRACAKPG